ncbi:MAG: hypothetical protein ACFE9N_15955 [Promethearchaeota archaeon]
MEKDQQMIKDEFFRLNSLSTIKGVKDMLSAMEKFYIRRKYMDIDVRFQVMAEILRTEVEDPKKQEEMIKDFEEFEEASNEVILMEIKIFNISKFIDGEIEGIDRYKEVYDLNKETDDFLSHIQSRFQSIKEQLDDWLNEEKELHGWVT